MNLSAVRFKTFILPLWFSMLKAPLDILLLTDSIRNPLFMFHLIRQEQVTLFVWSGNRQLDHFQAA